MADVVKWRMVGMIVGGALVAGVALMVEAPAIARLGSILIGIAATVLGVSVFLRNRDAPWM